MGKRSETDEAFRNLMNWAQRPEWAQEQSAVFDAYLGPVGAHINLAQDSLIHELEEHGYGGMLFGVMFEDFISRRLPDGRNLIDDYLTFSQNVGAANSQQNPVNTDSYHNLPVV